MLNARTVNSSNHCFARLKARELTAEEIGAISGGGVVTAGDTGIQIEETSLGYTITGDDGHF